MKKIELLAPVGQMESLYAAVQNGADAVYLGGRMFNARHYASNFSNEELKEAVTYAHLRGVSLYVTVNVLIDDEEMLDALDYVKFLYDIGVDGIIVQDLGLATLVSKSIPNIELHASTQMTVNNLSGARLLEELGFTRIVLARETPIEEIKHIIDNCPVEIEVFVHGALCVAYSGQCLMSSMIGGRSGNRGECAQPCRMPSSLISQDGRLVGGWENKHILSLKDLNTIDEIDQLVEIGVTSLKIEGRMKRPEYVATVVGQYRKALDFGVHKLTCEDKEDIEQIFNRGFTRGFMFSDFGRSMVGYNRPNNRGLYLGKVVGVSSKSVKIRLDRDLEDTDGIEFHLANNSYKGMRSGTSGLAGEVIEVKKIASIKNNTKVYKSSSTGLLERAKKSYEEDRIKRRLDLDIELRLGKNPRLRGYSGGIEKLVSIDSMVEKSKKSPLDEKRVLDQLSKLGDSLYYLGDLNISMDEGIFLPVSKLNELRRTLIKELDIEILSHYKRPRLTKESYVEARDKAMSLRKLKVRNKIISAKFESLDLLMRTDLKSLDRVYLSFYTSGDIYKALKILREKDIEVFIATEKILYRRDLETLKSFLDKNIDAIDGVSVSNLGSLEFVRKNYNLSIHGDLGMNLFNSYTGKALKSFGINSCSLSPELNYQQIKNISSRTELELSLLVYGYLPVMVTRYCPMSLVKSCKTDKKCEACEYKLGYKIKDRIGAEFPFIRKGGHTNIYNSVPLFMLEDLDKIKGLNVGEIRLDFTFDSEYVEDVVAVYSSYLRGEISISQAREFNDKYRKQVEITKGHFNRGILN